MNIVEMVSDKSSLEGEITTKVYGMVILIEVRIKRNLFRVTSQMGEIGMVSSEEIIILKDKYRYKAHTFKDLC